VGAERGEVCVQKVLAATPEDISAQIPGD